MRQLMGGTSLNNPAPAANVQPPDLIQFPKYGQPQGYTQIQNNSQPLANPAQPSASAVAILDADAQLRAALAELAELKAKEAQKKEKNRRKKEARKARKVQVANAAANANASADTPTTAAQSGGPADEVLQIIRESQAYYEERRRAMDEQYRKDEAAWIEEQIPKELPEAFLDNWPSDEAYRQGAPDTYAWRQEEFREQYRQFVIDNKEALLKQQQDQVRTGMRADGLPPRAGPSSGRSGGRTS